MKGLKILDAICATLLIIGGLNWGLVGLFQFDLVAAIFGGADAILSRIVYSLVGASAIYTGAALRAIKQRWTEKGPDVRTHDKRFAA